MENLSARVYECTLAVEAHMICDLLARAGISARVDGEFLAGAGGELPLGSTISVRVDPARAAEAREVIDEWQKLQPPDSSPTTAPGRGGGLLRGPLWFFVGAVCGAWFAYLGLNTPVTESGVDYDGDGDYETSYHYAGRKPTFTDVDRDNDGKVDARWHFDSHGLEKGYEADDDFDGHFEWQYTTKRGEVADAALDVDGDGRPEEADHFENGVIRTSEILEGSEGRIVARQKYTHGKLSSIELDLDGDGKFERHVEIDRFGLPK